MEDRPAECAFTIGRRVVELDRRAGLDGSDVADEMAALLNALVTAPSESAEDAHALAIVSWLLLLDALRRLPAGSPEEAKTRNIVHVAAVFGRRSVETLEGITGMPLGAFTGEDRFRQ